MAIFPAGMPAPQPNFDDRGFWESCNEKRLRFQCCAQCATARHPPTPVCARCRSLEQAWKETAGRGTVYSYTVIHHASHEAVKPNLPYVVAVVEFDDVPGVRLVTNVTDVPPRDVRIGMRVELWWDRIGDASFLPRCRPAA